MKNINYKVTYDDAKILNIAILSNVFLYKYCSTNPDKYEKIDLLSLVRRYQDYMLILDDDSEYLKSFEDWLLTEI